MSMALEKMRKNQNSTSLWLRRRDCSSQMICGQKFPIYLDFCPCLMISAPLLFTIPKTMTATALHLKSRAQNCPACGQEDCHHFPMEGCGGQRSGQWVTLPRTQWWPLSKWWTEHGGCTVGSCWAGKSRRFSLNYRFMEVFDQVDERCRDSGDTRRAWNYSQAQH